MISVIIIEKELPPRARRIRTIGESADLITGTTSACAENTVLSLLQRLRLWNYLRVRGEYKLAFSRSPAV